MNTLRNQGSRKKTERRTSSQQQQNEPDTNPGHAQADTQPSKEVIALINALKSEFNNANEQRRTENEQQSSINKALAKATWILAGVGALQAYILIGYANSTQSIAISTEKAANASSTNAKATQQDLHTSERAYFQVGNKILTTSIKEGVNLGWAYHLQNAGKTAFTVTEYFLAHTLSTTGPTLGRSWATGEWKKCHQLIGPNNDMLLSDGFATGLTQDQVNKINTGKLFIHSAIQVKYTDVFGVSYLDYLYTFTFNPHMRDAQSNGAFVTDPPE